MSQYSHFTVDLSNENFPATKIARLVGRDRSVLDVGCAHGYLAEALGTLGCRVVGVERDVEDARRARAHCEDVVVGDLEAPRWWEPLAERRFDAIVFADVLEHLRDPMAVLRDATRLLVPQTGSVIASIPNVAHVSVRLELLLGSFRRETLGILDATHRHFFTRDTVAELFAGAGLTITAWDCTTFDVGDAVIADYLRRAGLDYTPALREEFSRFEAIAYQFIVTARPAAAGERHAPAPPAPKPLATAEATLRALNRLRTVPEQVATPSDGGLRVLQVVHQFLPHRTAGTEIYCADLSFALRRRGHAVHVLAGAAFRGDVGTSVLWDGDDAIVVEKVPAERQYRVLSAIAGFFDRFDNPDGRRAIRDTLDRVRPDVVHVQHLLHLSAALFTECRRRGIPVVVTLNDYWFLCHRVKLRRRDGSLCAGPARGWRCSPCMNAPAFARARLNPLALGANLYRYAYLTRQLAMADRILAPSRYLRDVHGRNGVPAARILHCDYGTASPPPEIALPRPLPSGPVRIGFLGTLLFDKGAHVLVDAFERLPEGAAELHLFGADADPEYAAGLRARATRSDIHWRGPVAYADRWRALADIDVLVVPSVWYENSPLILHEARVAGVPMIASAIGGNPELVDHGVTGLTFPAGDAQALAGCLRAVVDDPGRLAAWRQAIRPPKTMAEHAAEIETIYRDVRTHAARAPRPS